ncbi:DUF2637 domain-containing protein [Streptomyces sp. CC53]|uniref:DUF2637 domain-containing protein n=1 Tax=Streptomyces sp. CC53 TaxID=1906740 RepID=UPI000AF1E378|nr:DUF2637 domain-containing protein [Streptomyces sp. CC53]
MTATPRRRLSRLTRIAWYAVLAMMLAAAAWSISGTLTSWGMNPKLAWALSLMFDLAALLCAEYARRAIERASPAGLARVVLLGFVSVSATLNWSHGMQLGGPVAAYGLASVPCAVELLFELHRRDVRDEQRAERGLLPERMPHIPLLGWLMYPARSWQTLRGAVGARLDQLDPVQTEARHPQRDTPGHAAGTVRSAVRAALSTIPDASAEDVLEHLHTLGSDADEDTVRTLMDTGQDSKDSKDSRSQASARPIAPPGQSVTDTIRTAVAAGLLDRDKVVSYGQKIHGPDVDTRSVVRLHNRVLKEHAPTSRRIAQTR